MTLQNFCVSYRPIGAIFAPMGPASVFSFEGFTFFVSLFVVNLVKIKSGMLGAQILHRTLFH